MHELRNLLASHWAHWGPRALSFPAWVLRGGPEHCHCPHGCSGGGGGAEHVAAHSLLLGRVRDGKRAEPLSLCPRDVTPRIASLIYPSIYPSPPPKPPPPPPKGASGEWLAGGVVVVQNQAVAPYRVRIVCVSPGIFETVLQPSLTYITTSKLCPHCSNGWNSMPGESFPPSLCMMCHRAAWVGDADAYLCLFPIW